MPDLRYFLDITEPTAIPLTRQFLLGEHIEENFLLSKSLPQPTSEGVRYFNVTAVQSTRWSEG